MPKRQAGASARWNAATQHPYQKPQPSEFERMLEKLGVSEAQAAQSPAMRKWVRQNCDTKFVPEAVLNACDLSAAADCEE